MIASVLSALSSKLGVVLLIIALAVGLLGVWHLRSLEVDKSLLKDQIIADLKATVQSNQQALSLKTQSCEIDNSLIAQLDSERQEITKKSSEIENAINRLKIQSVIDRSIKPLGANESENKRLPDDGLLSLELTSLLNKAYCNAEPTNNICIPSK